MAPSASAAQLVVGFDDGVAASQRSASIAATGATTVADVRQIQTSVIQVPDASLASVRAELQRDPRVQYVAADGMARAAWAPDDPRASSQYALDLLGLRQAWEISRGAGITIADVDTGVDSTHPDLAGKVIAGYDFVANDAVPADENGHGTHVAGILAANTGNGLGVAGTAPDSRILAVRVLDANGSGYLSTIARGIVYAVDHGAQVVNLSLGGASDSTPLHDAIKYAADHGVVVACATGNDSRGSLSYPAAYPECLSVGATNAVDALASFSNYGAGIQVVAPGQGILSTVPNAGYESWSGTSMATPYVAGIAALLAAQGRTRSQILDAITSSAHDLGAPGYDDHFGYGRVDAAAALGAAPTPTTTTPTPTPASPPVTTTPPTVAPAPAPRCTRVRIVHTRRGTLRIRVRCTSGHGRISYRMLAAPRHGNVTSFDRARGVLTYTAAAGTARNDALVLAAKTPGSKVRTLRLSLRAA